LEKPWEKFRDQLINARLKPTGKPLVDFDEEKMSILDKLDAVYWDP
jgi:hypothetical protein